MTNTNEVMEAMAVVGQNMEEANQDTAVIGKDVLPNDGFTPVMNGTKREYLNLLKEIVSASGANSTDDLLGFLDHEIELMDRKYDKIKEKKDNGANAAIKELVLEVLAEKETPISVGDLMTDPRLETYIEGETVKKMTNQKLSSMIYQLDKEGKVEKTVLKRRSYYSIKKEED